MLWSKNEWVCAYHWDQPHRIQPEVMVLTPGSPWTGRLQWLVQIPLNQGPPRCVLTGLGCSPWGFIWRWGGWAAQCFLDWGLPGVSHPLPTRQRLL